MTTKTTLRCLAIRQPFAWAIAVGAKDIENRSWSTDHRGTFVIQASSTKTAVNRVAKKLGRKGAEGDDAFRIFEGRNANGRPLTQADRGLSHGASDRDSA